MRNKGILAAGLAVGAVTGYVWKRRKDTRADRAAREHVARLYRDQIPGDVIEGGLGCVDDLYEFDDIATYTCMAPCCYVPLTQDEVEAYGLPVGEDGETWID